MILESLIQNNLLAEKLVIDFKKSN